MNVDQFGSVQLALNKPIRSGCRRRQQARNAALLAAGVTVWCGGASATPNCQGTYAATLLQPLPERVVVDLDIRDRSQRNLMLADRFLRGVRAVGIAVLAGRERGVACEYVAAGGNIIRGRSRCRTELFRAGRPGWRWDAAQVTVDANDGYEGVATCTGGATAACGTG